MSGLGFLLDPRDFATAADDLQGIADRAGEPRPAMTAISHLLLAGNKEVFESQGSAIDTPWPELKASTLRRKKRMPSLFSMMVESGDLQEAATGGSGSRRRASRSSASAGVTPFYAVFHKETRPPIGIPAGTEAESLTLLEQYLIRGAF